MKKKKNNNYKRSYYFLSFDVRNRIPAKKAIKLNQTILKPTLIAGTIKIVVGLEMFLR